MATTKLKAVNEILKAVGVSPVDSLQSGVFEAEQAEQTLDTVSLEVQSGNWDFNREDDIKLPLNVDGSVNVPLDVLRLDASDKSLKIVTRSGKLYDKAAHTFTFKAPLSVEVVWNLTWEDLPEPARQYIYLLAAQRFQLTFLGSDTLDKQLDGFVKQAYYRLRNYDTETGDYNILTGDVDTLNIWNR